MKKIGTAFPILLTLFAALILFSGCRGHEETGGGDAVAAALVEDLETLSHPVSEDDETDVSGDALDAEREEAYRSASALLEQAEKNNRSADYLSAFESFKPIDGYLDSHEKAEACCDGYIRSYFGSREYLDYSGHFKPYDKILLPLYKMYKFGAANDFALIMEMLSAGDYQGICKLASDDPQFCGQFRREAGDLLWQKASRMSSRLVYIRSDFQTILDDTWIVACAADQLTGSVGGGGMDSDLFSEEAGSAPDIYVSESIYEYLLANYGTEAAGKVLVTFVLHPYQYSAAAALVMHTEYGLSFSVMEKLPAERFPLSLAETEYILQCDSGYQFVGVYDSGTDAVREYTSVKLLKFPGNELLDETTVYGDDPPEKIEYTGNAPPYQSGGKPSTQEVSAAILRFFAVITETD